MNGNEPVTRADIANLDLKIDQKIDQLRTEMKELRGEMHQTHDELRNANEMLRSEMNHNYNDLVERIHDAQTSILSAFYSAGQGTN